MTNAEKVEPTVAAASTTTQATAALGDHRSLAARLRRTGSFLAAHRTFAIALALGAVLRIVAMLGYHPAMWFSDSFDYVHGALSPYPNPIRPSGYSFLLMLLEPFHNFALVVGVQHLMGLATAVMVYALLRRHGVLPGWGATLATVPVLFDAYEVQLEQLVLSDTTFMFLGVAAVTLLLWSRGSTLSWKIAAAAGALLGLAALTRSIGLALLGVAAIYLIIRRVGWRAVAATVIACAIPMSIYAGWFASWYGKPGLTRSDGVFLYSRVMQFADCAKIQPPARERPLCTDVPAGRRPSSQSYIWDRKSPLFRLPAHRFSKGQNDLAGDFARRAVMAQPGDYLSTVYQDVARVFRWDRAVFPDRAIYDRYEFRPGSSGRPGWGTGRKTGALAEANSYHRGFAGTRTTEPYAGFLSSYQQYVYLHGTMLGVILLAGLAGIVRRWRHMGGPALLPWTAAVALLVVPAAVAEFDHRYVLAAVPFACLGAAYAFTKRAL